MAKISLILIKGTQGYDISDLVIQLKWSGRKGSSARTLEATLLDDDGHDNARAGVNVEEGHQCIFSYDGVELFRGIIMKQGQTQKKQLTFKAYDNGPVIVSLKCQLLFLRLSLLHNNSAEQFHAVVTENTLMALLNIDSGSCVVVAVVVKEGRFKGAGGRAFPPAPL